MILEVIFSMCSLQVTEAFAYRIYGIILESSHESFSQHHFGLQCLQQKQFLSIMVIHCLNRKKNPTSAFALLSLTQAAHAHITALGHQGTA